MATSLDLNRTHLATTGTNAALSNAPASTAFRDSSESSSVGGPLYCFEQCVLDPQRRTLSRANSPVVLTPKAFDVLLFLVQNPNRLVTKEELLQSVWGDTFVEEGNLTQYISLLRKAMGHPAGTRLIATITRKGYQFTGDVTVVQGAQIGTPGTVRARGKEGSWVDEQQVKFSTKNGAQGEPAHWRKRVVVTACTIIVVVVGYVFWRHPRYITVPKSGKVMLAVLPFENLTGDSNKEYLADGLTEETISQLGRLNPEQLGVIARTSVMGYKHTDERLDKIGRDLSVQYVLENSLRESGDHLRLTTQLIQVKDQTHLWAQDYDYPAKDILNVEDDVAKVVAQQIRLRLASKQQAELAQSRPVNPQAFDAYLRGYYFFQRNTDQDTNMSASYYERATQLDPSYASAWVGLSRARNWQAVRGLIPSEEGHRLAREAVERALALNPNLAEAHAQMGRIKIQVDFDWAGADDSLRRAIALDPGNPENVRLEAFSATMLGRSDEALALARRAIDLDPLNNDSWESFGEINFLVGRLEQASAPLKKAIELEPDISNGHLFLSLIYIMQARPQDAVPEIERVQSDDGRLYLYALAYHTLGQKKRSDVILSDLIAKYHVIDAYQIAEVYAFRNQPDKAFEWLGRAYAQHDDGLIATKVDPLLKSLHTDPRFAALLKKLRLPN